MKRYPTGYGGFEDEAQRVTYNYDVAGRLESVVGARITERFGYYNTGQLPWKVLEHPWGKLKAEWTYDAQGRVDTITCPYNPDKNPPAIPVKRYKYKYNDADRNQWVSPPEDVLTNVASLSYGERGELTGMSAAYDFGTMNQSWGYNEAGLMTSYSLAKTGETTVNVTYDYGTTPAAGKLSCMVQNGLRVDYTYDELGRVTSTTKNATPSWQQIVQYDGFGNITAKTGSAGGTGVMWPVMSSAKN